MQHRWWALQAYYMHQCVCHIKAQITHGARRARKTTVYFKNDRSAFGFAELEITRPKEIELLAHVGDERFKLRVALEKRLICIAVAQPPPPA